MSAVSSHATRLLSTRARLFPHKLFSALTVVSHLVRGQLLQLAVHNDAMQHDKTGRLLKQAPNECLPVGSVTHAIDMSSGFFPFDTSTILHVQLGNFNLQIRIQTKGNL